METMGAMRALLLAIVLLAGCALTSQQAMLRPDLNLARTDLGRGTTVALKVVDERPDKTLGHRGAGMKGAKITTDQDVAEVFRDKIVEGLQTYNFDPVTASGNTPKSLTVEIRLIEYSTSQGFATIAIHTKTALKAIARDGGRTYLTFPMLHFSEHSGTFPAYTL
jgi:uncharacterized lipoprotein YajG